MNVCKLLQVSKWLLFSKCHCWCIIHYHIYHIAVTINKVWLFNICILIHYIKAQKMKIVKNNDLYN